jgi:hypothetical protein
VVDPINGLIRNRPLEKKDHQPGEDGHCGPIEQALHVNRLISFCTSGRGAECSVRSIATPHRTPSEAELRARVGLTRRQISNSDKISKIEYVRDKKC